MARPVKPLPTGDVEDRRLVNFASALRALRAQAGGPTLAEMSQHSGVCTASLSGAHSGHKLPSWRTVEGYVRACGAEGAPWRSRWDDVRLARYSDRADEQHAALIKKWTNTRRLSPPQRVKDEAELARSLDQMRQFRSLSLRDLARRSVGFSHHTYGAVLRGDRPVTTGILVAILHSCGVESGDAHRWLLVLARVRPGEELRVRSLLVKARSRTGAGVPAPRGAGRPSPRRGAGAGGSPMGVGTTTARR